ncbi:MAG: NAD(+)/NADH kinase [Chloroflexi bacterium]|jgi:NAD+ kinase|nr:NAD(+)/NADH kinase [Anaerolineaceae bacterium]NMB90694.1 NAD(+)/NADH kinase [Chloroflexota bacterium]
MRDPVSQPRRFAVAYHPNLPEAAVEAHSITRSLQEVGAERVEVASLYDNVLMNHIQDRIFDVLIAVGGDGTMLRAGRLCAPAHLPVLGINLGHFGFLIELRPADWPARLALLMEGGYHLEDRMTLHAEHWNGSERLGAWDVLNEVVVCRGQFVRPVQLTASVDGYPMSTYVADGLIASTPTGSTAYALAAGGPIMPPELRNILIIPVAPHLSMDRAIILAEGSSVKIEVETRHEAVFSVDGHAPITIRLGEYVQAVTGENVVTFVRFQDPGYFYRNLSGYREQNHSISGV